MPRGAPPLRPRARSQGLAEGAMPPRGPRQGDRGGVGGRDSARPPPLPSRPGLSTGRARRPAGARGPHCSVTVAGPRDRGRGYRTNTATRLNGGHEKIIKATTIAKARHRGGRGRALAGPPRDSIHGAHGAERPPGAALWAASSPRKIKTSPRPPPSPATGAPHRRQPRPAGSQGGASPRGRPAGQGAD